VVDGFSVRENFFTTYTHDTLEQRTSLLTRQRRYKIVPSNRGTCVGSGPYGLRTRIIEPRVDSSIASAYTGSFEGL
jgi:hypothetical protein